jgi:hypothetical protein
VLDTSAAAALGYQPVGDYATTVAAEVDWLVELAGAGRADQLDPDYFDGYVDYAAEDAYLSRR